MIKRFYHRLFAKENPKFVRDRFVNVPSSELYKGMEKFALKYFKDEGTASMAKYLFSILGLKELTSTNRGCSVSREAEEFKILLESFSKPRFERLFESRYFRALANFISKGNLPNSDKSWKEHLLKTESKYFKKDYDRYYKAMERIFQKALSDSENFQY